MRPSFLCGCLDDLSIMSPEVRLLSVPLWQRPSSCRSDHTASPRCCSSSLTCNLWFVNVPFPRLPAQLNLGHESWGCRNAVCYQEHAVFQPLEFTTDDTKSIILKGGTSWHSDDSFEQHARACKIPLKLFFFGMLILKTKYARFNKSGLMTRKLTLPKRRQDSTEVLHSLTADRSRQVPGEEECRRGHL